MSTTTVRPETTGDAAAQIDAAVGRLAERMTSEYTPIWEVSDFLLDAATALSGDPLAVAEVHGLLEDLAPSAQRTLVRTTEVAAIVEKVRGLAEVEAGTTSDVS